jgi:hypothetical protein
MKDSDLIHLGVVRCINTNDKYERRIPDPSWFGNIRLLREFLGLVVRDWTREVVPYQNAVDSGATEDERLLRMAKAFLELQPYFLKCLFSYCVFFVSLQCAYEQFYSELNALNRETSLKVSHDSCPKTNEYIEKVRRIRNLSVAHPGSRREVNLANRSLSMQWQPMSLHKMFTESWDLNAMTFGGFQVTMRDALGNITGKSDDFKIVGILEMDGQCSTYLDEYDRVCAAYLNAIMTKLPKRVDNYEYKAFLTK